MITGFAKDSHFTTPQGLLVNNSVADVSRLYTGGTVNVVTKGNDTPLLVAQDVQATNGDTLATVLNGVSLAVVKWGAGVVSDSATTTYDSESTFAQTDASTDLATATGTVHTLSDLGTLANGQYNSKANILAYLETTYGDTNDKALNTTSEIDNAVLGLKAYKKAASTLGLSPDNLNLVNTLINSAHLLGAGFTYNASKGKFTGTSEWGQNLSVDYSDDEAGAKLLKKYMDDLILKAFTNYDKTTTDTNIQNYIDHLDAYTSYQEAGDAFNTDKNDDGLISKDHVNNLISTATNYSDEAKTAQTNYVATYLTKLPDGSYETNIALLNDAITAFNNNTTSFGIATSYAQAYYDAAKKVSTTKGNAVKKYLNDNFEYVSADGKTLVYTASAVNKSLVESTSGYKTHSFAVGTPDVPYDMLANIHKNEMIVPATFSEGVRKGDVQIGSQKEVVNAIQKLTNVVVSQANEIKTMRKEMQDQSDYLIGIEEKITA